MIKNLMKKILIVAALVTFAVYTISGLLNGHWSSTYFIWELFALSGLICVVLVFLNRFKSDYYLLEILLEYLVVIIIVGGLGLTFNWFKVQDLWQVFVYVTPVYVMGYFLDLVRTKRDLEFINEKIKKRSERGIGNGESDDNS